MIDLVAAILLAAGDKSLPVYIILPGAIIVPLAVLYVFTFLKPPKGGAGH